MTDARSEAHHGSPWRRVRECLFGLCTVWLVVQNTLLLIVALQHQPNTIELALAALQKAFVLLTPLWVIPAAALAGLALSAYLIRGAAGTRANSWEMEHGRTR
jgi:hypothetical protein